MDIIKEKCTGQPVYIKHNLSLWYPQVFYWRGVRVNVSLFSTHFSNWRTQKRPIWLSRCIFEKDKSYKKFFSEHKAIVLLTRSYSYEEVMVVLFLCLIATWNEFMFKYIYARCVTNYEKFHLIHLNILLIMKTNLEMDWHHKVL